MVCEAETCPAPSPVAHVLGMTMVQEQWTTYQKGVTPAGNGPGVAVEGQQVPQSLAAGCA